MGLSRFSEGAEGGLPACSSGPGTHRARGQQGEQQQQQQPGSLAGRQAGAEQEAATAAAAVSPPASPPSARCRFQSRKRKVYVDISK
ncbi:Hypothetical predicted protein [Podarcis lilfordi]|uniref:Uncharacterized protein n=1 Tax=Podarcis lilfordi TaxID=74358 RepID=A0AA35K8W9_9SAUR|nr:Hypothetical predicted protein [Podarcis lilfordi]